MCTLHAGGILMARMPRRERNPETRSTSGRSKSPALVVSIFVVGLIVSVGAVFMGKSDNGEIDVNSAIELANQTRHQTGDTSTADVETPTSAHRNMTNGGLVPQEGRPVETPPVIPEPETATETEATSTESSDDTTPETPLE
jgi:hypothetical protein